MPMQAAILLFQAWRAAAATLGPRRPSTGKQNRFHFTVLPRHNYHFTKTGSPQTKNTHKGDASLSRSHITAGQPHRAVQGRRPELQ